MSELNSSGLKRSLQVMQRADGLWYWRIIDARGALVDGGRQAGYMRRRTAVRKGRKWLDYHERAAAERWEDA